MRASIFAAVGLALSLPSVANAASPPRAVLASFRAHVLLRGASAYQYCKGGFGYITQTKGLRGWRVVQQETDAADKLNGISLKQVWTYEYRFNRTYNFTAAGRSGAWADWTQVDDGFNMQAYVTSYQVRNGHPTLIGTSWEICTTPKSIPPG